jgi:hypothetical protein
MRSDIWFEVTVRTYRLLFGFFAPPVFGSVLLLIFALVAESGASPTSTDRVFEYFSRLHAVIFFAFLFVGVRSLVLSIIM